ncbi:MAG: bile acid:sodium symporter family protein [Flavobacteriaceae bacterium]
MSDLNLTGIQIEFDPNALWLLNLALGFIMFGIALEIKPTHFKLLWESPKSVFAGLFSQFVALQTLTLTLVWLMEPATDIALGMFLVAACPGGNVSNFMSHLAGGNSALSISLTAISSVAAVIMTPLVFNTMVYFYLETTSATANFSISFLDMFEVVILILGIPLLLGMTFTHFLPLWSKRLSAVFKWVSVLFFVFLVVLMIVQNKSVFQASIASLFSVIVVHNLAALATGFAVALLFGLGLAERRTLSIETGIQNSGLGLLLIFTFFDQNKGMAVVAALWGIWHLISGMSLALFWSKR